MATPVRLVLALALAIAVSGCATTRIVHEWKNPDYTAPSFKRILTIGVSEEPAIRRTFEDELATRLRGAGVDAEPSYRYIPESGQVAEARLQEAVRQANADGAVITRLVRVETRTHVSPGLYYPAPLIGLGLYPGYSAAWIGYYEPPRVYQYDVYISETSLYDTARNQMVWSGTVQTRAPRDIGQEIRRYVDVVVEALQDRRLLPRRPRQGAPVEPWRSSVARSGQAPPAGAYLWPSRSSQRR